MSSSELGYIIDFIAGFFIIQSIILRSKRHIRAEAATLFDGNPLIYESQLKAFWDGWFGVILLFIGLIFHLFHFELEIENSLVIAVIFTFCPFALRLLVQKMIRSEVRKEYAHYDMVKEKTERGEY